MGGAHPLARAAAAVVGLAATVIPLLLALGVISPVGEKDALAESTARTLEAGSSKIRIDVSTGRGRTTLYTATGVFDYREDRGTFRYNLTKLPQSKAVAAAEVRFFQNVAFMHMAKRVGRPWVLIDLEDDPSELLASADEACGGGASDVGTVSEIRVEDPTRVLADLGDSAELEDLGADRRFGLELHKYRGTLDASDGRNRVTATAWIDDDDLVRHIELAGDGGAATTMTFYEFGAPVDTAPPPEDEVVTFREFVFDTIRQCAVRP